jgi:Homeodomain-like domain
MVRSNLWINSIEYLDSCDADIGDQQNHEDQRSEKPKQRLTTRRVAKRYGVSTRTIARWRQNPAIGFPASAASINGRDYYDEERLDQFDRECVLKATVGRPRIRRIEFTKGSDEKARP